MRNCVDEGTLQAWFDGELAPGAAVDVKAHLRACALCVESARILESENAVVSAGLAAEFAAAIPTEVLRERISAAVAALPGVSTPPARSWGQCRARFLCRISFAGLCRCGRRNSARRSTGPGLLKKE